MQRRTFLRRVLGGTFALPTPLVGSIAARAAEPPRSLDTRTFDLAELTISQLQAGLNQRRFTAASLVRKYVERIDKIDHQGPALRSVIEINPDALKLAEASDKDRRAKGPRGPLHGIPVLLKDNIDTRDRMSTTAGSLALEGSIPARDAFLVKKLREAGAVILGKTNLSEWANIRSTRSTSGWSARGGQTRNPYVLDRNPSGSSSGSAVAASANLCAVAVGTETDGSILSPSSYCGVVGIKPTVGLISRSGIIPISRTQDTAGPMARTVTDAAVLLGCMAGADPQDAATTQNGAKRSPDYTRYLEPGGLRGARIGIARQTFGSQPSVVRVMETALEIMGTEGAVIVDPADIPTAGQLGRPEFEVLLYEFKAGLNDYLAGLVSGAGVPNLEALIQFNERHREREMPWFGQEIFHQAQSKGSLSDPAYLDALAKCRRLSRDEGIDAVMGQHRLDAIVALTTGPAHVTDWVHGDRDTGGSTTPAAVAGYPSITVPAGWVGELPVGISFFGSAWSEPVLLRLAFGFEQATRVRRAPRLLPTLMPPA